MPFDALGRPSDVLKTKIKYKLGLGRGKVEKPGKVERPLGFQNHPNWTSSTLSLDQDGIFQVWAALGPAQ